jgi:ribosomal protein L16/L10AE
MAVDGINGATQLKALGVRLKALGAAGDLAASDNLGSLKFGGGKTLRAQLLTGIRIGAKPAVEAARQAARNTLPKKGGLNTFVADTQIVSRTRLTGPRVGVRIGVNKGVPGSKAHRAYGANKGTVNHPVFGHEDRRVVQELHSRGWFDKTLEQQQPVITAAVRSAMEAVAIEATRRLG